MDKHFKLIIEVPFGEKQGKGVLTECSLCKGTIYIDSQKGIIIDGKPYCLKCSVNKLRKLLPK